MTFDIQTHAMLHLWRQIRGMPRNLKLVIILSESELYAHLTMGIVGYNTSYKPI